MPLFGLIHRGDEVDVFLEPLSTISSGCSRRFALRFSLALNTSSIRFLSLAPSTSIKFYQTLVAFVSTDDFQQCRVNSYRK